MRMSLVCSVLACLLTAIGVSSVNAAIFGGIEFPQGESSFADSVIRYDPLHSGGPGPTNSNFTDPDEALGVPDPRSVSLGRGGLIELAFIDNLLTNSGDSARDLHIFEIGPDVENTHVAIRPTSATLLLLDPSDDSNSDGFFEIGQVFGSTSSIDIDAIFTGFLAGELQFDAVQLIDNRNEGQSSGSTVGADIDAVGAISSTAAPVPEPSSFLIFALGASSFVAVASRRRKNGRPDFRS